MPLREPNNFIRNIRIISLLSFVDSGYIDLLPLNVLIGPNASGKSNFLHAIAWIKQHPSNLGRYIRSLGGKHELVNKHKENRSSASILFEVNTMDPTHYLECKYGLLFDIDPALDIYVNEQIILKYLDKRDGIPITVRRGASGYHKQTNTADYREGKTTYEGASFSVLDDESSIARFNISDQTAAQTSSSLELYKDPNRFALQYFFSEQCKAIWISEQNLLSAADAIRGGQQADLTKDYLFDDFQNVIGIVNTIQRSLEGKQQIEHYLEQVNPSFKGLYTEIQGNRLFLHMYESDKKHAIPATRLSDGTLSFICLLAVLLQPKPPPIICLEEPELGLHPDMIGVVAELIIEASARTQIIVTTHSDLLVSAIGRSHPEAILVCEQSQDGTKLRRLDKEELSDWLTEYSLGELWLKGEIGGTRF